MNMGLCTRPFASGGSAPRGSYSGLGALHAWVGERSCCLPAPLACSALVAQPVCTPCFPAPSTGATFWGLRCSASTQAVALPACTPTNTNNQFGYGAADWQG